MPFLWVELLEGRSEETKRRLMEELTETVVRVTEAPKETVRVVIREHSRKDWAVGGIPMAERDQQN